MGDDEIFGGAGQDTMNDRDGAAYVDQMHCGDGTNDRAFVDSFDVVDPDCERVGVLDAAAPVAVADAVTVGEDSGVIAIAVMANDTDADGGPRRIASVTAPTHGTVTVNANSTRARYQPAPDHCTDPPGTTPVTFTYTLTPGSSTGTVAVTITCVDDPVKARNDARTVNEDAPATTLNVLVNDDAGDHGPISIDSVTQPADGTVAITNGGASLTYEPNDDFCNTPPGTEPDSFDYALDPGGDTATVDVKVNCQPDAPIARNDSAAVAAEDPATTIDVLANDTDADGDPFAIDVVTQPDNGTVVKTNAGADLTYAPDPGYCNNPPGTTPDTFTYTLSPGGDTATVSVTVTCAVNDDPVIAQVEGAALAYTEDDPATPVTATATVSDVDSADLGGGTLTVDLAGGTGQAEDRLAVRDQGTGAGQIGVAGSDVTFGGTTIGSLTGGSGTDPLLIGLDADATPAAVQALVRNITYRNASNSPVTADRTVRFVVTDGDGGTSTAVSRDITIAATNDAPMIDDLEETALAYPENAVATPVTASATVSDPDSAGFETGTLTVSLSAGGQPEDRLEIRNQGTGAGQIGVSGATVTFGGTTIGTVAGGSGTTPLVVTLNGSATPAAVEALVRNVTYRNVSESPSAVNRTVSFVLTDGDGGTSAPATRVVAVAPLNDAPVLAAIEGTTLAYTENDPGIPATATSTVGDVDSANLDTGTLTVSLSAGGQPEDRLEIRNQGTGAGQIGVSGATVTFGGTTIGTVAGGSGTTPLVVTLNGNATPAAVQALVRNVAYRNVSDNPVTSNRTVRFVLTDGDGGTSAAVTRAVSVSRVNDAPVISSLEGTALAYQENAAATPITDNALVTDADSDNFDTGTLTVDLPVGGAAEDRLEIRNQGTGAGQIGISGADVTYQGAPVGTFTGGSGTTPLVVTLRPNTNPTILRAMVRNITYRNVSDTPSTANRTARFVLTDGDGGTGAPATRVISVAAVNDVPVLAGFEAAALTYAESDPATVITSVGVLTDVDSANFDTGTLTVDFSAGGLAEDRLEIRNVGNGPGQIGVSGSTVSRGGVSIGTFAGGSGTTPLVITLDADASPSIAQVLMRHITYRNVSDSPSTGSRTVRFVVTDGDGGTSAPRTRTVNVSPTNDAPVIGAIETAALGYTENSAAVPITATGTVTEPDVTDFDTGTLTVSYSVGGDSFDRLEIRNQGSGTGQIGVSGSTVSYGGLAFGTFTGGSGTTPLVITFNNFATPSRTQALVRNITYRNLADNLATLTRTVRFVLTDGDGGTSAPATRAVTLTAVNDIPVVANVETTTLAYTENGPATVITAAGTVSDLDSANFGGGTLTIDYAAGGTADDRLEIRNQGTGAGQIGVSGSNVTYQGATVGTFAGGSGTTPLVITFQNTSTATTTQALLRNITYRNVSDTPSTVDRTVRFVLDDGDGGASTPDTRVVTVASANDAPVLAAIESTALIYRFGESAKVVTASTTVADPDSANFSGGSLTVDHAAGGLAEDRLGIRNQGFGTGQIGTGTTGVFYSNVQIGSFAGGSGTTPLVITLNASATPVAVQALVRNITYRSVASEPTLGDRTVRFVLTDGDGGTSDAVTRVATVFNATPVLTPDSGAFEYLEGSPDTTLEARVSPGMLLDDPDDSYMTGATVSLSPYVPGDRLKPYQLLENGTEVFDTTTGVLTFTGVSTDLIYQGILRSVRFSSTREHFPESSITVTFRVSDGSSWSAPVSRTINFTNVNSPPRLADASASSSYTEQSATSALVTPGLVLTDADTATTSSATVTITSPVAGDTLTFTNQNGITGSFASGVLTLTGTTSTANYQAALRSVGFRNTTSDAPLSSRSFVVRANDGSLNSTGLTRTISITQVNDAPTISDGSASTTYTERTTFGSYVTPSLALVDPDSNIITGATITITGPLAGDELVVDAAGGITGSFANGVLTLTGSVSRGNYAAVLSTVRFRNTTNHDPGLSRTFTIRVTDGALSSNDLVRTINITPS